VYCLSGLGIVRKNRGKPKYFNTQKVFDLIQTHFFYRFLLFLYDPLTTSLHALKKSIIHGAIEQVETPRPLKYSNFARVGGCQRFILNPLQPINLDILINFHAKLRAS
jgi:hypothetical protein